MKKRITALFLAVVSILSMLTAPASAAAPDTIKMDDCAYSGTKYDSPALGECYMHQMHFALNGKSTMGFCAEKGKGMGWSLKGHTWGNPKPISDPTVKTMMAYFYAHSTGVFTDQAKALGVDDVWDSNYTWTMNSWTQAVVWRYKAGLLSDPVVACAEELLCVYNNLEHTSYTSIDDTMDGRSFRDRAQYILDLGSQGVWGECSVYEYAYTGVSTSYHQASDVQAIMIGELNIIRQKYDLTVKKVDSTNPNKGLAGARFMVRSEKETLSPAMEMADYGNELINAILWSKCEIAKREGLFMEIQVMVPPSIPVKGYHICSLLGNLIDNAIEGSRGVKAPRIHITIQMKQSYLYCCVRNRVDRDVLRDNPNLFTTKEDASNHGFCIWTVKKIVEKYHGMVDFSVREGEFLATAMLLCQKGKD